MCLKVPIKTPERRIWRLSGVFINNFEYNQRNILYSYVIFLFMTLNIVFWNLDLNSFIDAIQLSLSLFLNKNF